MYGWHPEYCGISIMQYPVRFRPKKGHLGINGLLSIHSIVRLDPISPDETDAIAERFDGTKIICAPSGNEN